MIVCTRHPRCYVLKQCALQERVSAAMIEAQRHGDEAIVVLVERDNPGHAALAAIGSVATYEAAKVLARELGMRDL